MEIHRYKYFAIRRLAIIEKLSDETLVDLRMKIQIILLRYQPVYKFLKGASSLCIE